jgi:hypothetical protein
MKNVFIILLLFIFLAVSLFLFSPPTLIQEKLPDKINNSYWNNTKKSQYLIVIDYSGSMENKNHFLKLKKSIFSLIDNKILIGDKVSVIKFAEDAHSIYSNFEIKTKNDKEILKKGISQIRPSGAWTDIAIGYTSASDEMNRLAHLNPAFRSIMLIYTDNIDDPPPYKQVAITSSFNDYLRLYEENSGLKTYFQETESQESPFTNESSLDEYNQLDTEIKNITSKQISLNPSKYLYLINRYNSMITTFEKELQIVSDPKKEETINRLKMEMENQKIAVELIQNKISENETERLEILEQSSIYMGDQTNFSKLLLYPENEDTKIKPNSHLIPVTYNSETIENITSDYAKKASFFYALSFFLPSLLFLSLSIFFYSSWRISLSIFFFTFILTILLLPYIDKFLKPSSYLFYELLCKFNLL